jgi:hypothetical protein
MRSDKAREFTYQDFAGGSPGLYLLQEPRHRMTTKSGHRQHAPRIPFSPALGATVQHNGFDISAYDLDPLDSRLTSNWDTKLLPRVDINDPDYDLAHNTALDAIELSDEIRRVIEQGSGAAASTFVPPWSAPGPATNSTQLEREGFANQFAAAITDYADFADTDANPPGPGTESAHRLTGITASDGKVYFGMERLPAITEVYLQRCYELDWEEIDRLLPPPPPLRVVWGATDVNRLGPTGYAIEIHNPWDRIIDLSEVQIKIGSSAAVELLSLVTPNNPPYMDPDELIVLYLNSGDNTAPGPPDPNNDFEDPANENGIEETDPQYNGSPLYPTPGFTEAQNAIPEFEAPYVVGAPNIPIELIAKADIVGLGGAVTPGQDVVYQRFEVEPLDDRNIEGSLAGLNLQITTSPPNLQPNAIKAWLQGSTIASAKSVNSLLAHNPSMYRDQREVIPTGNASAVPDAIAQLGVYDKVNAVDVFTDTDRGFSRWLIRDSSLDDDGDGESDGISYVGELAHVVTLGPVRDAGVDQPVAEVFDTRNAVHNPGVKTFEKFMLDFKMDDATPIVTHPYSNNPSVEPGRGTGKWATTNPDLAPSYMGVSHATLLLDRFSTLTPGMDGEDNDGDGNADYFPDPTTGALETSEGILRGTINLNTASRDFMMRALPFPTDDPNATELWNNTSGRYDLRRQLANVLATYRDDPLARPLNSRDRVNLDPGITHLSETLHLFNKQQASATPPALANTNDATAMPFLDQSDNCAIPFNGVQTAPPEDPTWGPFTNAVVDDRVEQTQIMKWLAQTCATRSDFFTAYVLIRGWPEELAAPRARDAIEERRVIFSIDRSEATPANQSVSVVPIYP